MSTDAYIEKTEQNVLHTYNRFPVVFEKGDGVWLTDSEGRRYLDFGAGIAVMALGYGNQDYANALKEQTDRLIHTSNLFYNVPMAEAAEKLTGVSDMDKVFFTNSGTEAVEGAIKAARKYAWLKNGRDDNEIIAMHHSFHGRSVGALSVTGNQQYREPFEPLMGGVKFAEFNDLESVRALVNDRSCAIILEPVLGEGGVLPADPAFLKGLRALCDEQDLLLIFDEIQCGMGRCGSWFAFQQYGVKPDILTAGKALGCGFPVGAFALNKKTAEASLVPGDHGSTYGGNPLACTAVSKVIDLFGELHIIEHVKSITPYLEQRLDELVQKHACLKMRRGFGLMQGLVLEKEAVGEVTGRALDNGLIVLSAEGNVLRLVPPLIVEREEIDEMICRLERSL